MTQEFDERQEMLINRNYKIWKKQAPNRYDFMILHSLDLPSYTFQWLANITYNQNYTQHYAIISSNSIQNDQCKLLKLNILIPNQNKYQKYIGNIGNINKNNNKNKINIIDSINHNGQINRARYCPTNSSIIAVSTCSGDINLLNFENNNNNNNNNNIYRLVSHSSQGYGLNWNPHSTGILASGQTDKKICIWNIQKNKQQNNKIYPIIQILHHNAPIQDVSWHKYYPNILASCSDDRLIMLWDLRFRNNTIHHNQNKPLFEIIAHTNQVYSLDFSPFNEFLFLSSSGDQTTSLWDMRNLTRSVQNYHLAKNSIIKVQWNPFNASIFGTCGYGRNVDIIDISKDNNVNINVNNEIENGLLFRHQGHRSRVLDFNWNKNQKLIIGSVEQQNCLHIWQMNKSIYYEEDQNK